MSNSYLKKDLRLLNTLGLVLGVQPEGIQAGGFTRLMNTKIYREGALGLRDQRELFAGLKTSIAGELHGMPATPIIDGRGGWFNLITRYDSLYLIGFHGTSVSIWDWKIPDPAFAGETPAPTTSGSIGFFQFLPEPGIPTTVSVLPNDRSIPVTYFSKPGVERMWKLVTDTAATPAEGRKTPGAKPLGPFTIQIGDEIEDDDAIQAAATSPVASSVPPESAGALRVYFWGINAPTGRPTATIQDGTGGADDIVGGQDSTVGGAQQYDWLYTQVNLATGHESNPSAGLEAIISVDTKAVMLTLPIDTGGDDQIGAFRVYRKGGLNPSYQRVGEVSLSDEEHLIGEGAAAAVQFLDKKSDAEISLSPKAKFDNYVPFVSTNQKGDAVWNAVCPFIFGPFADRVVLGLGEKNQPGNLFWTNPGRPDSSKAGNNVQVTSARDPLVSGVIYNGQPFVASRGDWYALDFQAGEGGTAIFTPRRTQAGKGPLGPWSVASGDMIYFITPEGVMMTDGQGPAESISNDIRPIFYEEDVGEYKAINFTAAQELFRLYWADPELHFLYPDSEGEMRQLIFEGRKWRSEEFARPGLISGTGLNDEKEYPLEPWNYEPLMHTTCVYDDVAWPSRSLFLGTDSRAVFRQLPKRSTGIEIAQFAWTGRARTSADTWDLTSTPGYVLGHFRTNSDEYGLPAMLKEIGDVSFEAKNRGDAFAQSDYDDYGHGTQTEVTRGKVQLTMYANAESGSREIKDGQEPSDALTGEPIGSTIYNATKYARQKFPFSVPDDFVYSTAWDYQFFGQWELHNMTTFWRKDTEVITHWHQDNLNHAVNGWQHLRDGYLDARLYGAATIILKIDEDSNKTQTVTLSPTWTRPDGTSVDMTGERYKYYFSFAPVKGKKFSWDLDCTAGMRIYSEGSEINGKQWITEKGYQTLNPFAEGAE